MKYIYILGMEHSGSTFVSSLVAQYGSTVALGEVARFLCPSRLREYQQRWGKDGEAVLCSCGRNWWECSFWSGIEPAWGLNENEKKTDRYLRFFEHLRAVYGDHVTIVDSSKTLEDLDYIVGNIERFPMDIGDVHVLLVVKDPRSFAASIKGKSPQRYTVLDIVRTLNWWHAVNSQYLSYLREKSVSWSCVQYEKFCLGRGTIGREIFAEDSVSIKDSENHIVLSNKDFLASKSIETMYDYRWFSDRAIQWCYLLHHKVGRLNSQIYQLKAP